MGPSLRESQQVVTLKSFGVLGNRPSRRDPVIRAIQDSDTQMRPVQISIAPIMTTVGEIVVVTAQAWPITRFPMMTKITPMMFGAATQTIRSSLLMICSPPFVQPTRLSKNVLSGGKFSCRPDL
jgi:hypothetical protein